MSILVKRLLNDLKSDLRKTAAMLVLAAVLILVLCLVTFSKKEKPVVQAVPPPAATAAKPAAEKTFTPGGETMQSAAAPFFLTVALPFEQVGNDPFVVFFKKEEMEGGANPDPSRGEATSSLTRLENSALDKVRLQGTLTGGGEAYAVVDGIILKEGDEYKGFIIKKIGERSVTFSGQKVTRSIEIDF